MRVGIVGGGQLGLMLGEAAAALGIDCVFLDPSPSPPAALVGEVVHAGFDDADALRRLAADVDVLTYEFENVPVTALTGLGRDVRIYPPPEALACAQDRLSEKRLFDALDIPVPAYRRIDAPGDLDAAIDDLGLPLVVKTRRFGYDGKGQTVVHDAGDAGQAWQALGGGAAIAEAWVAYDRELSIIGARDPAGNIALWPVTRNEHADGILRTSRAPVDDAGPRRQAERHVRALLEHFGYVGVIALELFVVGELVLANEFAPRVHNSGHWTIEGAATSQFTNHLLTVTGRAPASTAARAHAGMLNLIGDIPDAVRDRLGDGCFLHDYHKSPRPGRKLGHVTVLADSAAARDARLAEFGACVTGSTRATGQST
ncbi:MAG: 5-(carboxyamino)imidazole ribonucleotide synthase [Woeseiaceae bacterium]|nr:5-(carboxyamino)imidazole ribonucleotide synthase [Woeseiaceae bacterium]